MPSFVSSAGYRSPRAVPPVVRRGFAAAEPPIVQEPGPIDAAEHRDAEWLATLDANDKLIESLEARVRAPPGARLERRLSAPA